jgi:CMP/dCMP kinase
MSKQRLITIDGPSASGKSSVSREVARHLSWPWVSTGAFYRGLALVALEKNIAADNPTQLVDLAGSQVWSIKMEPEDTLVLIDDVDVTPRIFGEKVGAMASQISQIPAVRDALLQRQRDCYDPKLGLVAEGRDCGTVVFPNASGKIYLTASPALRALRRSEQESGSLEETLKLQKNRDQQDSQRQHAPLKVADGALTIDSSYLTLEEVVAEVLKYVKPLVE